MPQKKNASKQNNGKPRNTAVRKAAEQQSVKNENTAGSVSRSLWSQIAPYLLMVASVLLVICFFTGTGSDPGVITGFVYTALTGLFGGSAFAIPAFLLFAAIASLCDKSEAFLGLRSIFAGISVLLVSALLELISPAGVFTVTVLFKRGVTLTGGGTLGGLLGEAFLVCFKSAGSYVLVIALLILSVLLCAGLTPKYVFQLIRYKLSLRRERRAEQRAAEAQLIAEQAKIEPEYIESTPAPAAPAASGKRSTLEVDPETGEVLEKEKIHRVTARRKKPKFDTDVPLDDFSEESPEEKRQRIDNAVFDEVMRRSKQTKTVAELAAERALFDSSAATAEKISAASKSPSDTDGLDIIDRIADAYIGEKGGDKASEAPAEMSVTRKTISEIPAKPAKQIPIEIPKPEYNFPPIELLSEDGGAKNDNVREEMHDNAAKLVSVLSSFNVKTKIVGVSRGPTITRYELLPEAGTRVRSIANLLDDISLNLATSGVRIEAPIPGKAAVGVEVPNKVAETVYLRSLITSPEFTKSKSNIATCLGKDVGGQPIIMDIKKMPHLLIAGATGMGKSVCINSLLVSILYKAAPSEVKLILIDPKKVEFSIYNGLPHLLVPVVSDPKKAAGSLNWAVNEMERRFCLIEAVGVRDIKTYNEVTQKDPDYETLPQIVIVIDELADLMSTAPDDVETSIARLAAKARAAGMHLIIGTQRPSVDVITGVIKANIPSRIAFTVASQVDSRTIIDRSGAENLIGRGDMLYNPVGASKPQRVQGAFVDEKEVDAVVTYIKEHNSSDGTAYSDDVMKQIEEAAAMCGTKKGGGGLSAQGDGSADSDPLMNKALDVAFESGKVSTSLLQRRLSVGYGRAAKIIDKMEQLGYVSAPEGQKPRELLISKQDYMELVLREEDPQ